MAELPRGTVTLIFTDIEGSTRLLNSLGSHYEAVLADHRRLLRDGVVQPPRSADPLPMPREAAFWTRVPKGRATDA